MRPTNAIFWQPRALRQMRKLGEPAIREIRAAVKLELSDLTQARNVGALVNHVYGFRLRVGPYRVFFDYDGAVHIVRIEEVRKRNERTY
jgi:mRNA interferase RelE/StbE